MRRSDAFYILRDRLVDSAEQELWRTFQGLTVAARAPRTAGVFDSRLTKAAERIDVAYNVVRHLTYRRFERTLNEFAEALKLKASQVQVDGSGTQRKYLEQECQTGLKLHHVGRPVIHHSIDDGDGYDYETEFYPVLVVHTLPEKPCTNQLGDFSSGAGIGAETQGAYKSGRGGIDKPLDSRADSNEDQIYDGDFSEGDCAEAVSERCADSSTDKLPESSGSVDSSIIGPGDKVSGSVDTDRISNSLVHGSAESSTDTISNSYADGWADSNTEKAFDCYAVDRDHWSPGDNDKAPKDPGFPCATCVNVRGRFSYLIPAAPEAKFRCYVCGERCAKNKAALCCLGCKSWSHEVCFPLCQRGEANAASV